MKGNEVKIVHLRGKLCGQTTVVGFGKIDKFF